MITRKLTAIENITFPFCFESESEEIAVYFSFQKVNEDGTYNNTYIWRLGDKTSDDDGDSFLSYLFNPAVVSGAGLYRVVCKLVTDEETIIRDLDYLDLVNE